MKDEQADITEVFFAKAGEVTANFNVFPEETLKQMADDDPRFRYVSETKTLYLRVCLSELKND